MGHKISKEQIDPGVKDHIMSFVGDVADLETEVNTDIISAVNSLMVDRADNIENIGKLANAIGEPVTANHSVDEVVEGLGEMLSTFKTNMMNNGITVESGDKFKSLIDKLQNIDSSSEMDLTVVASDEVICSSNLQSQYSQSNTFNFNCYIPGSIRIKVTKINDNMTITLNHKRNNETILTQNISTTTIDLDILYGDNIVISGTMAHGGDSTTATRNISICGNIVFNQSTNLRDSLASILENKGVDVTEEDDMASLITKVDEEFDEIVDILNERGLLDEDGTVEDVKYILNNLIIPKIESGKAYTLVDCESTGWVLGGSSVTKTYTIENLPNCIINSLLIHAKANAQYDSYSDGWIDYTVGAGGDKITVTHERNGEVLKTIIDGNTGQFQYGSGWGIDIGVIDGDIKNGDTVRLVASCTASNDYRLSLSDIKISYDIII